VVGDDDDIAISCSYMCWMMIFFKFFSPCVCCPRNSERNSSKKKKPENLTVRRCVSDSLASCNKFSR
jgi:hypothetical protein